MQVVQVPRHPLDPDPVRSSKAGAVFGLGLLGAITGVFVGGVVPATVALVLARQARREAFASGGFLTGSAWVRRGERLAWVGIFLCLAAVVVGVALGVVDMTANPGGQDFDPTID